MKIAWWSAKVVLMLVVVGALYGFSRPDDLMAARDFGRQLLSQWLSSLIQPAAARPKPDRISMKQAELQDLEQEAEVVGSTLREQQIVQQADRAQLARVEQLLDDPQSQLDRDSLQLSKKALEYFMAARAPQLVELEKQHERLKKEIAATRHQVIAARAELARSGVPEMIQELTAGDATPRAALTQQYTLLIGGRTAELRQCFTPRLHSRINDELVCLGRRVYLQESFADLAHEFEVDQIKGTCQVRSKSGVEVTTLVRSNGQWLADRIWFE